MTFLMNRWRGDIGMRMEFMMLLLRVHWNFMKSFSQDSECIYPECYELLEPFVGFQEYDGDYYFGCAAEASTSDDFDWDVWYVYAVGAVFVIAFIGLVYFGCKGQKRINANAAAGYKTQLTNVENDDSVYGATKPMED